MCQWNKQQTGRQGSLTDFDIYFKSLLTSIKRYMYIFDNLYNLILIFTAIQEGNVRNQECNSKFSSAMQNTTANTHLYQKKIKAVVKQ